MATAMPMREPQMTERHLAEPWDASEWLNPPPDWSLDANRTLHVTSGDRTDFWQATHYGFRRDDGHALLREATGPFTVTLGFEGRYAHLYDQAGLMLRAGANDWIKFGIEWTDGAARLSVVATRGGLSDWSAQPLMLGGPVHLRATRLGAAALLQWWDGADWRMARLAPHPGGDGPVRVGPCLCSPERSGFEARFETFSIDAPQVGGLDE
jgi:regulation of enolase protein 1 (concanavalin A-like superfamily)